MRCRSASCSAATARAAVRAAFSSRERWAVKRSVIEKRSFDRRSVTSFESSYCLTTSVKCSATLGSWKEAKSWSVNGMTGAMGS